MNRILGIDYGERRIGLALSDPLYIIAKPYKIIDRKITINYLEEILKISKEYSVNKIIVGMPFKLNGDSTLQTKIVDSFIQKLESICEFEIIAIDERLSSIAAKNYLKEQGVKTGHEKGRVDETAAAIILQEYLDSKPK